MPEQEQPVILRKPDSLPEFVFNLLREHIVHGAIAPGTRIKQLEIARQLQVSQQTVREALKTLEAFGLVEQTPNHGFAVAHIPFQEQAGIFKLRCQLETFAIDEAVQHISSNELKRMRELVPVASLVGSLPIPQIRRNNREFHMIPIRATQNKQLIRIMDQLWDMTWTYFNFFSAESQSRLTRQELKEHETIIRALENKDPPAAKQAVQDHIQTALQELHHLLMARMQEKEVEEQTIA